MQVDVVCSRVDLYPTAWVVPDALSTWTRRCGRRWCGRCQPFPGGHNGGDSTINNATNSSVKLLIIWRWMISTWVEGVGTNETLVVCDKEDFGKNQRLVIFTLVSHRWTDCTRWPQNMVEDRIVETPPMTGHASNVVFTSNCYCFLWRERQFCCCWYTAMAVIFDFTQELEVSCVLLQQAACKVLKEARY